jgi:cytochrome c-type biogenesis protein
MINDLFTSLTLAMNQSVWIALSASFVWGILSILLSPCHLSSIPLVVGFINVDKTKSTRRAFGLSFVFAFGILITIALIGLITASFGRLMGDVGEFGNYFVAVIFIIIGLYLMDLVRLPGEGIGMSSTRFRGYRAALILGLLFGIALGPCTFAYMAPVLSIVFGVAQTQFVYALGLLTAFGIGHCAVIVLAGTLTQKVSSYLKWSEESRVTAWVKRICGGLILVTGLYMLWSGLTI